MSLQSKNMEKRIFWSQISQICWVKYVDDPFYSMYHVEDYQTKKSSKYDNEDQH